MNALFQKFDCNRFERVQSLQSTLFKQSLNFSGLDEIDIKDDCTLVQVNLFSILVDNKWFSTKSNVSKVVANRSESLYNSITPRYTCTDSNIYASIVILFMA